MPAVHCAHRLRLALSQAMMNVCCSVESVEHDRRRVPMSYGRNLRGWHPVRDGHGAIAYESKLEQHVISLLASYPELVRIRSQPITVRYREGGRIRAYTPDFHVHLSKVPNKLTPWGFLRDTYIEVKPYRHALDLGRDLAVKFATIRAAVGQPIVLVTELDTSAMARGMGHGE
jgi:hypothetical protein